MASCGNILKAINGKGRVVYFLGYNSAYTGNMARFLNGLLKLDDFGEESPAEILEKAEVDGMEFVPCQNPEEIADDESTMFVDYGKKVASLPHMEVLGIDEFLEEWDAKIVEVDGKRCVDYDDDDPQPLRPWPEQFKGLLDAKEADFASAKALCGFFEEEFLPADYLCEGRIVHCEDL